MLLTPSTELRSSYNASADFLLNPNLCQQEQKWAPNLGTLFFPPRGVSPKRYVHTYHTVPTYRFGEAPRGEAPRGEAPRVASLSLGDDLSLSPLRPSF